MPKYKTNSGGGWASIRYVYKVAKKVGGLNKLYSALDKPNTCKACALGKGGKKGGLLDEIGHGFQVCKKSMQAQAHDMLPGIPKEFFKKTSLDEFSIMSGKDLESLGRLVHPLYLPEGGTHFQPLSWPVAHEILLKRWKEADPDRSFFYSSGRSSNEAAFLAQLLVRQWGSGNINNCAYYCHQASGMGLALSMGGGTSTVQLDDISKSDLVVLIGANPASNHPRLMRHLMWLKRYGGKVVVINPLRELGLTRFRIPTDIRSLLFGSKISDLYLQPHCGGDLALVKAALVQLCQRGKLNKPFLENHCNNLKEFYEDLESQDLKNLLDKAGVNFEELNSLCDHISSSENTIFAWGMGITQQRHGVDTVRAVANLALARGMIGKPGAGLLPLRGHSNVQGVATVGMTPQVKPQMAQSLAKRLNISLPSTPGKDTYSCLEAAFRGEMDFAMPIGGNLYGASPNRKWAREALRKINFTAFICTTLNLGHIHGHGKNTLILPVRARDEEKQGTSQESMFNYVRLSLGGAEAPCEDLPSETEIYVKLGTALFGENPFPWPKMADHREIRRFIAETVPNMKPMAELDSGGEFTIPGRIKHDAGFSTSCGKANLAVAKAPDARPAQGSFNLMTMRSEGQFNTIIYEEEDLYRGVEQRKVVLMNKADISVLRISEGDWVRVRSKVGEMKVEVVEAPIRQGNLGMYFPEANILVPCDIDPQSKTPSYKRVEVVVLKEKCNYSASL